MGLFYPFLSEPRVKMVGVEAGGLGIRSGKHAASIRSGSVGILHGNRTYLLQDSAGQIQPAHSISAGLDYPGVGPEHSYLHDQGRVEYTTVTDGEAVQAFQLLSETEGIIPALESAHAIAEVVRIAPRLGRNRIVVANVSGRGDKDMNTVAGYLGVSL
jgi:tryptophan synthase beta chain